MAVARLIGWAPLGGSGTRLKGMALFKSGTCFAGMTATAVFQVCISWLDQESRMRKSIVTIET